MTDPIATGRPITEADHARLNAAIAATDLQTAAYLLAHQQAGINRHAAGDEFHRWLSTWTGRVPPADIKSMLAGGIAAIEREAAEAVKLERAAAVRKGTL